MRAIAGIPHFNQGVQVNGAWNNAEGNAPTFAKGWGDALETLAGVGRKTANVVLNIAFGHPTIAVDTHLFRLGNRIGLAPGKTPLAVEKRYLKRIPAEYRRHAHHWLILHGRYVCKARKPDCGACIVNEVCGYKAKLL